MLGFLMRLAARLPFLFIAGRAYGPDIVGRYAIAVLVIEFAALFATLGLKRGLAQALATTDRPHVHVVFDALVVAMVGSALAAGALILFPQAMFPNSPVTGLERFVALVIFATVASDVMLAALAYRHNVKASVTARAVVEPWTISIAAFGFSYVSTRDGLLYAYVAAMTAALLASVLPFLREYGLPRGWSPRPSDIWALARRNAPLAGADTIEWATRNVDRFILGLLFSPAVVGIYYMAQQVVSVPQKLKTSFDPILAPVITQSLAAGNLPAIAKQVRQVGFWIICAQAALTLMFAIPAVGVMGLIGPQFPAGAAALCILLIAEVLASPGAVAETALVYTARLRNLIVSLCLFLLQIGLSFGFVMLFRACGYSEMVQACGPAIALALSLTIGSVIKGIMLRRITGASVISLRPSFFAAIVVACLIGSVFTSLPHEYEWLELSLGMPMILASFLYIIIRFGFGPEDKALFKKMPKTQPELPDPRA